MSTYLERKAEREAAQSKTPYGQALAAAKEQGDVFQLHNEPYGSTIVASAVYNADDHTVTGVQVYKSVTNRLFHCSTTDVELEPKPTILYHIGPSQWETGHKTLVAM